MKYLYVLLAFVFLCIPTEELLAQAPKSGTTLMGKVVDAEQGKALQYASVAVFQEGDSSFVTGGMTDEMGQFKLSLSPSTYFVRIKFLGYENKVVSGVLIEQGSKELTLKKISVKQVATTLDEVEITSRKSRMKFSLDKRVFNVGQDLSNQGGSAIDLLDNIPSVTTDIDGNVSLRGNAGVRILVNGRPSGLTSANALQSLTANMIERVEIITNPSARYEAEGTAGVINIVLRKDKRFGWNGSLNAALGWPHRHNATANLNFRRKRLNWFTSIGGRYGRYPRQTFENRERSENGILNSIQRQDAESYRGGLSGNIRFGADYHFDERTVLTAAIFYRKDDGLNENEILYSNFDGNLTLENLLERNTEEIELEEGLDYSLTFEKKFKQKGHKFSARMAYENEEESEAMDVEEDSLSAARVVQSTRFQRIRNSDAFEEWVFMVDYEKPVGENGKFEVGYRGSVRNIDTRFRVEELDPEINEWEVVSNLSNNFEYDEDIHAIYASYGNEVGRFSYQLGLRNEYTHIKTRLVQTNEVNDRSYTNLFPSVFLSYNLGEANDLQLSYSRRLTRPRFWDLNPFFGYTNPRNIRSGNPNLNPEFTDSYELSHIKTWNKTTLSTSIYYRHVNDVIIRIPRLIEGNILRTMPENLTTQDDIGLEFTLNTTPLKDWDLTLSANFFRGQINGENLSFLGRTRFNSMTSRLNTRFNFAPKWVGQVMLNYQGAERTPTGNRKDMLFTDLGISHDVLKDKATISMRVSNLFNTFYRYEYIDDNTYLYREGQWRSIRRVFLNFVYRINQKKKPARGRRGGYGMD